MTNPTTKMQQPLRRSLAIATAVVAIAAPTAYAAPVDPVGQILSDTGGGQKPSEEQSYSSLNSISPYTPTNSPSSVPVAGASDGFDWGDAGIGATAMLALAGMAAGAAIVVRHRPQGGDRPA